MAVVQPCQRIGQVSFARTTTLLAEKQLLDSIAPPSQLPGGHNVLLKCRTVSRGELPTLAIDTSATGGFTELRPFTEVTVFVVVATEADTEVGRQRTRVMGVLNHFLNQYRLVTQDPWVRPVDHELDLYLIDDAVGRIPESLRSATTSDVLLALGEIPFDKRIGRWRNYTYRLNTLEDLFPGPVLEEPFHSTFAKLVEVPYEVPLHYDLIFEAQGQLKRRNYHVAVLEAETAFEVYVADLLLRLKVSLGESREAVLAAMEDLRALGPLTKRIVELDRTLLDIARERGWPTPQAFVGTHHHAGWKRDLYDLRNRVIHGGHRAIDFEQAKRGILKCKAAIGHFERNCGDFANRIQVYPGGDHLNNTAGRLSF